MNLFKFDFRDNTFMCRGSNSCQTHAKSRSKNNILNHKNYEVKDLDRLRDIFKSNLDMYEICITIKPKIHDERNHALIYQDVNKSINNFFIKKFKELKQNNYGLDKYEIHLFTEYSDKCRLHFHGVCFYISPQILNDLRIKIQRQFGLTTINKVKHINYLTYITKDVLKDINIPTYTVFNLNAPK